jgi:hypothetical protein
MQMTDTTLVLGEFQFGALEIPAEIEFGGTQRLSIHELVGGVRVIDAMGRSDKPLSWSGLLLGSGRQTAGGPIVDTPAVQRAQFLDGLRIGGQVQELSFGEFRYQVIVREFSANYQRHYQIPYRIVCEVVQDLTTPTQAPGSTPIDQAMSTDAGTAQGLSDSIGNSTLSGLMTTLNSAISAVSSFAQAAQSTINGVLQPLAAVQAQVQVLITSTANVIGSVTTFGGVLPGSPIAVQAAKLTEQVTAVSQSSQLYNLRNVLGRMGSNLGAINGSQNTVATAGGNLMQIAQKQYGDAMAWTGIAKASGLTDPFVQGAKVLTIPPQAEKQGGVLNA